MIERSAVLHDLVQSKERLKTSQEQPGVEEERFYGHMRGMQDTGRVIEIRRRQGNWPALRYVYLKYSEWIHAGEFRLYYITGETVTVKGRNLRPLYDHLLMEKLAYIREAAPDEKAPEHELFVDEVAYDPGGDKESSTEGIAP